VWIHRINLTFKSISCLRYKPIRIGNAAGVNSSRRPAQAEVVLRSSIDVVKRLGIVHRYPVKLGDWKVGLKVPIIRTIKGFVQAAITTYYHVVGIFWINPKAVIVHMALVSG